MSGRRYMTRRQLCIAGAGVLGMAALGMSGCSSTEEDDGEGVTWRHGFGGLNDTVVRLYPVTLKIYADSNLQWMQENPGAGSYDGNESRLDQLVMWYHSQVDRSDVSFDFVYVDPFDLLEMAREGFPDGDGVIALKETVAEGCDAGTIDGGEGKYMVRDLGTTLDDWLLVVRAIDSGVELPPARTLTGENSPDGSINQLQELPNFDGLIGIADPETTTEGSMALKVLDFHAGLFTFDEGSTTSGTFDESIADKIVFFPDEDAAIAALVTGECQLSFALKSALGRAYTGLSPRYPQIESCYRPPNGIVIYHASALTGAPEPGVARDFFEALAVLGW